MKATFRKKYPHYLPLWYIIFLILRKVIRQGQLRLLEAKAKKKPVNPEFQDGPGEWSQERGLKDPLDAINKPAFWIDEDFNDPSIKELVSKMDALRVLLDARRLHYCSPAGTFIPNTYIAQTVRIKMWENSWVIHHSNVRPKDAVLDLGGAATLFGFYLASIGCSVRVIDNDWGNCGIVYNTNYVARIMNWDIKARNYDLSRPLPFGDSIFDRVFLICVIEHLSCAVRRSVMKEVSRVLKSGGIASLTFDYDPQRNCLLSDKGLRFAYREKIERDIIQPSGLKVLGNQEWFDAVSEKSFLGSLFLEKH
jgi:SAM-dependent methyltransferase